MSALIALAAIALWAWFGALLWKRLIRPRFDSALALAFATILWAGIWFIGPVIDEILGARDFAQLCQEIPEVKFHGPVAIGPGAFFDEQGNPRWKNEDEFSAIKRNTKDWYALFDTRTDWSKLRSWPIPIFQSRGIDFVKSSGAPVVESFYRTSPGGWIKRQLGWGMQAPYQCARKGRFPQDAELIVFRGK